LDVETRLRAMKVHEYLQSLLRNYESLDANLANYWCGLAEKLDGFVNRSLCVSDFTYLAFTDFGLSDFIAVLISEYFYTIWLVRKEVSFDGKTFDRTSLLYCLSRCISEIESTLIFKG
jgi:hypothetical protein